jgi:hypothetical protein
VNGEDGLSQIPAARRQSLRASPAVLVSWLSVPDAAGRSARDWEPYLDARVLQEDELVLEC